MDKLPVELLLNIFEFLDTSGRNECNRACRRWNNILTWSPVFRKERILHLRRCLLRPELEPFKSLIEGKSQCFDKIKIGQMLRISPDCDMFWKPNFSHIVSLEMNQHQSQNFPAERFISMFAGFKHLEHLTLTNFSQQNMGILSEDYLQKMERSHVKFNVLKIIVVDFEPSYCDSYYFWEKFYELISKLINFCPAMVKIFMNLPALKIGYGFGRDNIKDERLLLGKNLIVRWRQ